MVKKLPHYSMSRTAIPGVLIGWIHLQKVPHSKLGGATCCGRNRLMKNHVTMLCPKRKVVRREDWFPLIDSSQRCRQFGAVSIAFDIPESLKAQRLNLAIVSFADPILEFSERRLLRSQVPERLLKWQS